MALPSLTSPFPLHTQDGAYLSFSRVCTRARANASTSHPSIVRRNTCCFFHKVLFTLFSFSSHSPLILFSFSPLSLSVFLFSRPAFTLSHYKCCFSLYFPLSLLSSSPSLVFSFFSRSVASRTIDFRRGDALSKHFFFFFFFLFFVLLSGPFHLFFSLPLWCTYG